MTLFCSEYRAKRGHGHKRSRARLNHTGLPSPGGCCQSGIATAGVTGQALDVWWRRGAEGLLEFLGGKG